MPLLRKKWVWRSGTEKQDGKQITMQRVMAKTPRWERDKVFCHMLQRCDDTVTNSLKSMAEHKKAEKEVNSIHLLELTKNRQLEQRTQSKTGWGWRLWQHGLKVRWNLPIWHRRFARLFSTLQVSDQPVWECKWRKAPQWVQSKKWQGHSLKQIHCEHFPFRTQRQKIQPLERWNGRWLCKWCKCQVPSLVGRDSSLLSWHMRLTTNPIGRRDLLFNKLAMKTKVNDQVLQMSEDGTPLKWMMS